MKVLPATYAFTVFLAAFLLFLLEPIAARRILPVFGGSASVWTTCLVFFQIALLAGYCYSHLLIARSRGRSQTLIHTALLAVAIASLGAHFQPNSDAIVWRPISTILLLLTITVGLPFFALAATTPLLQAWGGKQRWSFFALSNTASLLALFVYPLWIEPYLTLHQQRVLWAAGFTVFAILCGGLSLQRLQIGEKRKPFSETGVDAEVAEKLKPQTAALWILLPACGSMLLCSVTSFLSQNIAAVPLLWILPLAAYLLSFIVAFASPVSYPRFVAVRMLALALATFAYLIYYSRSALPVGISIPVYVAAMFFACLFCHGELYLLRPESGDPTKFYLLLSLGSALGAIFVGVVAPNIFSANYDLVLSLILLSALALLTTWKQGISLIFLWGTATACVIYIAFAQVRTYQENAVAQLRSFYGSLRVTEGHLPPEADMTRTLYHGTIQHGTQMFGNDLQNVPTTYFARDSGVGLAIESCCSDHSAAVGIVGLGAGTLAAYGRKGDSYTFYEIDPAVERLSRAWFTYRRNSAAKIDIVLGDARLSLAREDPQKKFDVLALDAFTGDAIPVHLLTAQAVALYLQHLKPGGVLAFHISSQYLDLAPELALQAEHAGLHAVMVHSPAKEDRSEFTADWVLMSRDPASLASPEIVNASSPLKTKPGLRLWTDDYSSLLPLIKWKGMRAGS